MYNTVFNNLTSLDELITIITETNKCTPEQFKIRLEFFKDFLRDEYPDFSVEELLKIDKNIGRLKNIFNFSGYSDYFTAIEFEIRKNQ